MSESRMAKFGKVAVFCGGFSRERNISLQTGAAIYDAIIGAGVDAVLVDTASKKIDLTQFDLAFIALHGKGGEDGKFQAWLEINGLPYTGSGVSASSLSMNKWHTKAVWQSVGLPTPEYQLVYPNMNVSIDLMNINFPVYVKPVSEGSSIGITYAHNNEELDAAIINAGEYDSHILIERTIIGREMTFSYIEDHDLPLIELVTITDFYDYEAKYSRGDTQYIVEPDIPESISRRCKVLANDAFKCLGMRGWGRIDFILDEQEEPWLIEANSVPGMTSHSLVPMAAEHIGMSLDKACIKILEAAINE